MKKRIDFRFIIIFWNVVTAVLGLVLYVISLPWSEGYSKADMDRTYSLIFIAAPVVSIVLLGIMFRIMSPLKRFVTLRERGEEVPESLYFKARKVSLRLTVVILVSNLVGFFIGPNVGFLISLGQGLLLPDWLAAHAVNVLLCTSMGFATGVIAVFITNVILAKYKVLLEMHTIYRDKGERELSFRAKTLIVFLSLFVFCFGTTLYVAYTERAKTAEVVRMVKEAKEGGEALSRIEAYLAGKGDLNHFLAVFGPIFLAYLGLLWIFFTQDHLKQIRLLKDKCLDILQGKKDLSRRLNLIAFDEVGELAVVINDFIDSVRNMLLDTKTVFEEVLSSSGVIEGIASNSSRIIGSISDSSRMIGTSIDRQKTVFKDSDRTLGDMVGSFEKMAQSIERQSGYVETTSAVIEEVAANIASVTHSASNAEKLSAALKEAALKGNEAVANSIEAMRSISETSAHVEEIITVINGIADQTNLLGMNAAIEAAQAGQAGKGFSVVADEIRKLADDTAASAKEIIVYIKDMTGRISSGIQLSDQAGKALQEIVAGVIKTTSLINEISGAMNEQNKGVKDILSATTSLVEATGTIHDLTDQERKGNERVKGTMKDLVASYQDVIGLIELQIGQSKSIVDSVENINRAIVLNKDTVLKSKKFIESFKLSE